MALVSTGIGNNENARGSGIFWLHDRCTILELMERHITKCEITLSSSVSNIAREEHLLAIVIETK